MFNGWATHAICSEVLEHVDSPEDFLKASRVYLTDDCLLVVTVPSGPMSAFDRHIGHRQHFTRTKIAAVLAAAGFRVERIYRPGFPFFNLYRLAVIARGLQLVRDVDSKNTGVSSFVASAAMAIYRGLFRLNLNGIPLGWQLVAIARKNRD